MKIKSLSFYILSLILVLTISGCIPTAAVAPVATKKIEVKEYSVQQVRKPKPTFKKKAHFIHDKDHLYLLIKKICKLVIL